MQLTFRSMRRGVALAIAVLCLSVGLEIADASADPLAAPTPSSAALASSRRAAKDECGKRGKRRHKRGRHVRKGRARRDHRKGPHRGPRGRRDHVRPPPPMR